MDARTFIAAAAAPAYLLVAGEGADTIVLGVLVGVGLDEAERAAAQETMRRATRAGEYADEYGPGSEIPEELVYVRVQVSAILEPPAPEAGVVIFGAEAGTLPVGSLIQPLPPDAPTWGGAPAPPPMLRTRRGWQSTEQLAWENGGRSLVPSVAVRFRVMFRPPPQENT